MIYILLTSTEFAADSFTLSISVVGTSKIAVGSTNVNDGDSKGIVAVVSMDLQETVIEAQSMVVVGVGLLEIGDSASALLSSLPPSLCK